MASVVQLSAQDKKDLEKFTKFLALKSVQIIVQSRLGEKVHTKCNPQTSGTDWFNLAIKDLPEVVTEAKRAMYSGSSRLPLCVEISLRTVEGDTMTLETWCVGVLPELADPSARVTYTVYNRMGILLKSLVAVTRVTPAYKLSRRQGPDTYVICYRIYMGDPQLHSLGEGYNQKRVGQLSTPVGTLHLSVAYRTKMTISPQQSGKDTSIMLKSDHFRPDFNDSPKHDYKPQQSEETQQCSLSETVKHGAFADSKAVSVLKGKLVVDDVPPCPLLFPMVLAQPVAVPSLSTTPPQAAEDDNANLTPHNVSIGSHNDDFIMVDLKTPFSNTNIELNLFYRECQSAPPLQGLSEEVTLEQQVGDLARQLEQFETSLQEFDNVVTTLCNADNNN